MTSAQARGGNPPRRTLLRAHKIALDPTNRQSTALARAAGTARFAYNWALSRWNEQYEATREDASAPKPSHLKLCRELNAMKRQEFPWMLESTKCAPQEAILALGVAFTNFFAGRAKRPTFKKRGMHDSFRLSSGNFRIEAKRIRVPNVGWIRMREAVRFEQAKLVSVTISRTAGRWFVSVQCELADPPRAMIPASVIGVDVGVREFVASNGARYEVPRALRATQASLRRAQQMMSRRQAGSRNRAKARARVARLHARVTNVRVDWLHKLTTELADHHDRIVVEDLNVAGITRNRHLALSVADAGFGAFRRLLEYKTHERGTDLVVADRWFPSSKLCSACGARTKHLTLSQREWACERCGTRQDRDLNAARNLAAYDPAASSAVAACGAFMTAGASGHAEVRSRRDEAGTRHQALVNELE